MAMTDKTKFVLKPPQMTILSDHASQSSADDFLQMESRLAVVLDILRHKNTHCPITIAIYGDWGTGKTSAMHWLESQLDEWNKLNIKQRDNHLRVYPVWFDPWKYHTREEVWRGIIAEVILSLFRVSQLDHQNFRIRITEAAKKFGAFLGKSFLHALSHTELTLKTEAGTTGMTGGGEVKFSGEMFQDIYNEYEKANHPEKAHLNQFEETLKQWVDGFLKPDERIALFIDDLDRCMPEVTLEVLEAIKLYLNIPQIMFVVGVDRDVVDGVVIQHYGTHGLGKEKARQYLDKLFQVEIQIPPSEQQMGGFLSHQIIALNELTVGYWQSTLEADHRKALMQVILKLARHNPREIKRLLNSSLLLGRAAADNLLLTHSSGDTEKDCRLRFAQGVQLFLLQRLAQNQISNSSRLFIEERSLLWFKRASEFIQKNHGLILRLDKLLERYRVRENSKLEKELNHSTARRWRLGLPATTLGLTAEGLDELDALIEKRPCDDTGNAIDLSFFGQEVLWILLSVPFSVAVAQFVPVVNAATVEPAEATDNSNKHQSLLVHKAIALIEEFFTESGSALRINTGFKDLDNMAGGLRPGELIVIASLPEFGASTLALNIAIDVSVEQKIPVAVFSPNTSAESLMMQLITSTARVSLQGIRDGFLSEADFPKLTNACGRISQSKIQIDDTPDISMRILRERVRKLWKQNQLKLLVIDSFHDLYAQDNRSEIDYARESAEISAALKSLAKELSIAVVVVCTIKPTKQNQSKRLSLADLAEAGPVDKYFDSVIFISQDKDFTDEIDSDYDAINPVVLSLIKHRHGTVGEISLDYLKPFMCFESPTDEEIKKNSNEDKA